MTSFIEDTRVMCPYCGEQFDTTVDCSAGNQAFVDDCPVCCQPIEFQLQVGADGKFKDLLSRRDSD